jgi:steroid delta-isomerase-like uncharacterized protein
VTNEQIVREACRIIWTEHDLSRIDEFYAEDFKADYTFTDWGVGLAGIKALATRQRDAFPDYREHIDELIDGGDKIVVRLTVRGTHLGDFPGLPATGKEFAIRDMTICRIENGKIAAQTGLSDLLSFFVQAGAIELPGTAS